MLTMGKSMLEQVELRHGMRVAAAARSVDGVVAPVVQRRHTTPGPGEFKSPRASQRHVRRLQQVVGREEDGEGRPRIEEAAPNAGEEGAHPSFLINCFRQSAGPE